MIEQSPLPERFVDTTHQALDRVCTLESPSKLENLPLWAIAEQTVPAELSFELEVAEVLAAGFDPVSFLEMFQGRVQMVHLRDVARTGPLNGYRDVPHGDGELDFSNVIDAAADAGVGWLVYENKLEADPSSKPWVVRS